LDLRVVIIEDNPNYRHSLETLFKYAEGFYLATSFGSAQAAVYEVERLWREGKAPRWDMVLMDIDLPGMSGIEATRIIKGQLPNLSVVMLTVFEEPRTILEAIMAGADGYLLKKTSAPELLAQLRMIAEGGSPLTPDVARTVLSLMRTQIKLTTGGFIGNAPKKLDLTEREQEVLQSLVKGLSYKQVADQLGVSLDTIRTHIRGIYRKLQVHSAAEAVARAIRDRLV
jgi:DNA-binding NarL/FixJ family response regulator